MSRYKTFTPQIDYNTLGAYSVRHVHTNWGHCKILSKSPIMVMSARKKMWVSVRDV